MPFAAPTQLDDPNDPNKKNQGGGVNVSGQSASFSTNVPGQEQSNTAKPQKGSGQYTNIQSYLDANKGQADQMGQKITQDVSAKADTATQKLNDFQAQAPKVDAYDPNAVLNKATQASDAEKAAYKNYRQTGGYSGPQSVDQAQGYGDTMAAAQGASQAIKNAGSEAGQQQLLQQTYARPNYSAGENRLDQALLQNSAGSRANIEGLTQKYSGIDQMISGANQKVGEAIQSANAQAMANKNAFAPAEQAARKALLDPIQARAQQMNIDNPQFSSRVAQDASDNVLSDETLKALGLNEGDSILDLNLQKYVNPNQTQVGLDNAANADERQKYAALSSLFDDPSMNQISANGQAISPVGFNKDAFQADLAKRQAAVDAAKKNFVWDSPTQVGVDQFGNDFTYTNKDILNNPDYATAGKMLDGGLYNILDHAGPGQDPAEVQQMWSMINDLQNQGLVNRTRKLGPTMDRPETETDYKDSQILNSLQDLNNRYKSYANDNNIGFGREKSIKRG